MALDGSAKRGGLAAVVVTDDFGMLVSHSNASFELDMLAAVTPLVARGGTRARVEHRGQPCELKVQSIDLLGERLHFACLGGNARGRAMAMRDSLAATQRILA